MQVTHSSLLNGKRTLGDQKKDEQAVSSGTISAGGNARRVPIQGHCNAMRQHTSTQAMAIGIRVPDAVGGRLHLLELLQAM
jgi:hypothetical protein